MPLYPEHLHFLITRTGWLVTKIYAHYTFEQSKFNKDFVVMNQVVRQNAKTKVGKDFHKPINNSNFGNDCTNNIDNCNFKAIYDKIEEVSYIQKYVSLYFNDAYKDFACPVTIKQQIEQEYNAEMMKIVPDDPCAEAQKYCIGQKHASKIDAVDSMIAKTKRKKN